jgi:hypothetical protein
MDSANTRRRHKVASSVAVVTSVALGASAWAFVTLQGSGSANGSVTGVGNSTLRLRGSLRTIPTDGSSIEVPVTVLNPTSHAIRVHGASASWDSPPMFDGNGYPLDPSKCGPDDFTVTSATPGSAFYVPPATATGQGSNVWRNVTVRFNNNPNRNQNGCLGVELSFVFDVTM